MFLQNTIPYLLFLFVIFFFSIDGSVFQKRVKDCQYVKFLFTYIIFFISLYFIGCRGLVAADWYHYLPYFNKCPSVFDGWDKIVDFAQESYFELGYCILNVACKSISNSYFFFQFVCFLIDFIILHCFFSKYCGRYYILAWFLFWIFQGFVFEIIILRNTKAIMLFLLSLQYVEKRKPVSYFIINILAALLHASAIIYLPLYFVFHVQRNKKLEILFFVLGVIIYLCQISLFKLVFFNFYFLLPGRYKYLAEFYLNSDIYSISYGITLGFMERSFTFFLFYKFSDKFIEQDKRMRMFWYLFLLYSYSYLFMSDFKILIERIPNLFICSYWVLYPKIFGMLKKEWKCLFLIILVLYGIVRTISLLNQPWAYYDNFITGAMSDVQRKSLYSKAGY